MIAEQRTTIKMRWRLTICHKKRAERNGIDAMLININIMLANRCKRIREHRLQLSQRRAHTKITRHTIPANRTPSLKAHVKYETLERKQWRWFFKAFQTQLVSSFSICFCFCLLWFVVPCHVCVCVFSMLSLPSEQSKHSHLPSADVLWSHSMQKRTIETTFTLNLLLQLLLFIHFFLSSVFSTLDSRAVLFSFLFYHYNRQLLHSLVAQMN